MVFLVQGLHKKITDQFQFDDNLKIDIKYIVVVFNSMPRIFIITKHTFKRFY